MMIFGHLLHLTLLFSLFYAADTIVDEYLVIRHGDRTSKEILPISFTFFEIQKAYDIDVYFRDRYVDNDNTEIANISVDVVKLGQIAFSVSADDNVLQNSAQTFLQDLYSLISQIETFRNEKKV